MLPVLNCCIPAATSSFSSKLLLKIGFVIPGVEPDDYALCPVFADNGLRLFFGSSHEATLAPVLPVNALSIYYTERGTLTDAWQPPQRIAIDGGLSQVCPRAISADGCELWITYFTLGPGGNAVWHIARRD